MDPRLVKLVPGVYRNITPIIPDESRKGAKSVH